jgi:peptidoglycan hydrolase-like protein with peptidoglycan-binding domain
VTVSREDLVEVRTAAGQLGFGPEVQIESRLDGTVTALPPVGTVLDRGKALFRIDDQPVVLMFGAIPAYRDLTAGQSADPLAVPPLPAIPASNGADVRQLEENLRALGYAGLTVDEQFSGQTANVVRHWQKDIGLAQTGIVELGRVHYAAGPVRVSGHKLTPGALASGPVIGVTGVARLVTASLRSYDAQLARPGTKVVVELANGKETPGVVQSVNSAPDSQAAQGQQADLQVVVALDDPGAVGGLDDGLAKVRFSVQQRDSVLTVPVGALVALADGGFGLQVIEGGTSRFVAVTTGLFANGKVEVAGPDIREGLTVGMAQ